MIFLQVSYAPIDKRTIFSEDFFLQELQKQRLSDNFPVYIQLLPSKIFQLYYVIDHSPPNNLRREAQYAKFVP